MTETIEPRKITILAHRRAEAVGVLTKLIKKANRYGNEPITFTVGDVYEVKREYTDWDGETRSRRVELCDIEVTGSAPKAGPYDFLARLEHTDAGNLLQVVPGKDVTLHPRFRECSPVCEHCNTRRARKDTFVVLNRETGDQKQIGKNCLQDYLGIDPRAAIAKCAFEFASGDDLEEFGSFGDFHWSQTLEYLLTVTCTSIRIDGWLSKGAAGEHQESTATRVALLWHFRPNKEQREEIERMRSKLRPEDRELALKVIAWARALDTKGSDYLHNLKVACAKDELHNPRHVGLICSAVAAYNRDQELETRRRAELQSRKASKHVGSKGERLRNLKASVLLVRDLGESQWGHNILYKFLTIDGDVLTWITGKELEIAQGRAVEITATVKDHKEYQGILETALTRAVVDEIEDANHRVGA
jgi:hypothetical protein